MEFLFQWISQYGYAAIFVLLVLGIVGLPVPDETLLVFSGYLISKGRLQPVLAFVSAFSGSVCGISISYVLGRTLGHAAIERYGKLLHVTPPKVERVHQWFRRVGNWLLSIGYFIPGVRHFTALVAGMSGLEFRVFAPFAYAGGAVWVTLFLSLGYWFGENWQSIVVLTHRYTLPVVLLACGAAAILWLARNRRRNFREPLAKKCEPRD
jgi:membrane protein DedA with SNARE-associated domain